ASRSLPFPASPRFSPRCRRAVPSRRAAASSSKRAVRTGHLWSRWRRRTVRPASAMRSSPTLERLPAGPAPAAERRLIAVEGLSMSFRRPHSLLDRLSGRPAGIVRALNGVGFTVARGETLGIVGESGCGKSTLARCLVRLLEPQDGRIIYDGVNV